jgi:hypothetical protein
VIIDDGAEGVKGDPIDASALVAAHFLRYNIPELEEL